MDSTERPLDAVEKMRPCHHSPKLVKKKNKTLSRDPSNMILVHVHFSGQMNIYHRYVQGVYQGTEVTALTNLNILSMEPWIIT